MSDVNQATTTLTTHGKGPKEDVASDMFVTAINNAEAARQGDGTPDRLLDLLALAAPRGNTRFTWIWEALNAGAPVLALLLTGNHKPDVVVLIHIDGAWYLAFIYEAKLLARVNARRWQDNEEHRWDGVSQHQRFIDAWCTAKADVEGVPQTDSYAVLPWTKDVAALAALGVTQLGKTGDVLEVAWACLLAVGIPGGVVFGASLGQHLLRTVTFEEVGQVLTRSDPGHTPTPYDRAFARLCAALTVWKKVTSKMDDHRSGINSSPAKLLSEIARGRHPGAPLTAPVLPAVPTDIPHRTQLHATAEAATQVGIVFWEKPQSAERSACMRLPVVRSEPFRDFHYVYDRGGELGHRLYHGTDDTFSGVAIAAGVAPRTSFGERYRLSVERLWPAAGFPAFAGHLVVTGTAEATAGELAEERALNASAEPASALGPAGTAQARSTGPDVALVGKLMAALQSVPRTVPTGQPPVGSVTVHPSSHDVRSAVTDGRRIHAGTTERTLAWICYDPIPRGGPDCVKHPGRTTRVCACQIRDLLADILVVALPVIADHVAEHQEASTPLGVPRPLFPALQAR